MEQHDSNYIKKRLDDVMPILQKVALGDLNQAIPVPEEEDEFTAHFIALNFMIDDLRDLLEENKRQAKALSEINKNLEFEVAKRTKDLERKVNELEKINKITINRELKMIELKKKIKDLEDKLGTTPNPTDGI
jgi:methyl-accepting chemotaxis protein